MGIINTDFTMPGKDRPPQSFLDLKTQQGQINWLAQFLMSVNNVFDNVSGTVTTLESGASPYVEITFDDETNSASFEFFLPPGEQGEQGEPGNIQSVTAAATTLAPGSSATATVALDSTTQSIAFSFGLPEGTPATDAQTAAAVDAWIEAHPEAVTTVQDGAITTAKLADGAVTGKKIANMLPIEGHSLSYNLFSQAELLATGKYIYVENGHLVMYDNANMVSYILKTNESDYVFTHCRFAAVLEADMETAIGSAYENVTSVDATGGEYIAFSFNPNTYPTATYEVNEELQNYLMPPNFISATEKQIYGKTEGNIASGGYLQVLGKSALKDGYTVVFKGVLTNFNSIRLAFIHTDVTNYIDVDATNLIVKNTSSAAATYAHGLSISHDITLMVEIVDGYADITLISNGEIYAINTQWTQIQATASYPKIISTGTVCSWAKLESIYPCAKRNIYFFGDSYISLTNDARWPYYLKQFGYDKNAALNSSPGGTSAMSIWSLETLIKYGTPNIAVLGTGMNDGSDSTDAPSTTWTVYKEQFINICENAGITPVLCTIPTVPSVNNEQKNTWIRNSGYRYIDFAQAVGAQSDGTWYSGMLSVDGVHPTALGAKALFSQVLIDLPEILE